MAKDKRKSTTKHNKDPGKKQKGFVSLADSSRSAQGKQRQERRDGWATSRRQVIKVPEGAVLRGCKKTRRKLRAHLQLRAEVHSQLRVIASLFVLRIVLTCLVGYPSPGYAPTPPAVQPPPAPDAPPLPPLPPRAPAQSAPAQPASMECDSDSDSESPRKPPQPPRSSKAATQPGPSTPPPAKRSKPTQALSMQRIGERKWRALELCYWPEQGALPAKGKEYPGLVYKRLQDKPPKAQEQQPAVAQ
ncbi:hypothetical protein QJQ45_002093 [Haematococcus lacustris]|nr:hypothetical protein QJQ45_002093 [Haematococcus lacustris]